MKIKLWLIILLFALILFAFGCTYSGGGSTDVNNIDASRINFCSVDSDCTYIWYTGGCNNHKIVDIINAENEKKGIMIAAVEPIDGNVSCTCEQVSAELKLCQTHVKEIDSCTTDEDCILVQNGCCGCSAGGSNTSINKKYMFFWNREILGSKCTSVMCPAVMSNDYTCHGQVTPHCTVENKCVLSPPLLYE